MCRLYNTPKKSGLTLSLASCSRQSGTAATTQLGGWAVPTDIAAAAAAFHSGVDCCFTSTRVSTDKNSEGCIRAGQLHHLQSTCRSAPLEIMLLDMAERKQWLSGSSMGYITPSGPLMTPLPYLSPSSGSGIPDPGMPELVGSDRAVRIGHQPYSCRVHVPCKSWPRGRRAYPTGTLALGYGPIFFFSLPLQYLRRRGGELDEPLDSVTNGHALACAMLRSGQPSAGGDGVPLAILLSTLASDWRGSLPSAVAVIAGPAPVAFFWSSVHTGFSIVDSPSQWD